jgi:hypothetical protein
MSKGGEITAKDLDNRLRRLEILVATQVAITTFLVMPIGGFLAIALFQHLTGT